MFAITPPKLMNATNATFLQPMRNLNGEPYLQQVPVQPTVVQPILTTPQPNIPLTRVTNCKKNISTFSRVLELVGV